ncbi:MAG: universal stress protein [Bacteroidales bacterium]|jgi:nucleotide-binding universal stress UspA family protein|nr:universal stress protein [Bacteroidales bacterium]
MNGYKIIVAYDFQELSNAALQQAYKLASFVNGSILLLVVMDSDLLALADIFENAHSQKLKKKITDSMERQIAVRLQQVADKATADSGIPVSTRIETGRIYECILNVAREESPRFVVMGRTSRQLSFTRFGSNTMRVVERSNCPVLTIPSVNAITDFRHIVLPIDLTKQTREELFNAISFGLFFDATIHLVSVVMGGISEQKSRIYQKMHKMKQTIEENGVRCTEKLFRKSSTAIHEVILEYAETLQADAVMIMTHQEEIISTSDRYIGAVAHQIINESNVPVISLTSAASVSNNEKTKAWFDKLFGG